MELASPWFLSEPRPVYPQLSSTINVETAVIGGGIAGVMTAYALAKAGQSVALVEQAYIGSGATGWTTAFLTYVTDETLSALETRFGKNVARAAWESGRQAIGEIERIVIKEKIDCDFRRCPAFIFAENEDDRARLIAEGRVYKAEGFAAEFENSGLPFAPLGHLRVDGQAVFDPIKFIRTIAKRASERGANIFENTPVSGITGATRRKIRTPHGEIRADNVVVATYRPLEALRALCPKPVSKVTYVLEAEIVPGILPEAIYWDLREPYNYFRVDRSEKHDRIFLGGEDQSTEDSSAGEMRFKGLADFLGNILLRETPTIRRKWSGEILETADGLPYIGETANKGIYIATGFAGNGMTYGALSSSAISGSILGRPEPWAEIYRLNR